MLQGKDISNVCLELKAGGNVKCYELCNFITLVSTDDRYEHTQKNVLESLGLVVKSKEKNSKFKINSESESCLEQILDNDGLWGLNRINQRSKSACPSHQKLSLTHNMATVMALMLIS